MTKVGSGESVKQSTVRTQSAIVSISLSLRCASSLTYRSNVSEVIEANISEV